MDSKPLVSVIMPAYNCEAFVGEAINSILNQTYRSFEYFIIDDASTDTTVEVIKQFKDPRIKFIQKLENTGYTKSLNKGLQLASGKYIARMDADDKAFPQRLEKQVAFMESQPEIIACGSAYRIMDSRITKYFPENNEDIKTMLLEQTCFAHPTVMLRTAVLKEQNLVYDESKEPAEDYDLWVKLSKVGQLANIKEVLLEYRVHKGQVSKTRRKKQLQSKWHSRILILSELLPDIETKFGSLMYKIFLNQQLTFSEVKELTKLTNLLEKKNKLKQAFKEPEFSRYLQSLKSEHVKQYFFHPKRFTPKHFVDYCKLYFKQGFVMSSREIWILATKSLLFQKPKK